MKNQPAKTPVIRNVVMPNSVFTTRGLRRLTGLSEISIRREIREGRLKTYRRSRQNFFLGADVLTWLLGNPYTPPDAELKREMLLTEV
ncbi:MAG: hypothetical protein ACJ8FY_09780 [Gemmataceae bacterium]